MQAEHRDPSQSAEYDPWVPHGSYDHAPGSRDGGAARRGGQDPRHASPGAVAPPLPAPPPPALRPPASPPPQVAYLDIRVHYLRTTGIVLGGISKPVRFIINGDQVEMGSSGGVIPVAANTLLHIRTAGWGLMRSADSGIVWMRVPPGHVAPLYYSDSVWRNAPAKVSPVPFQRTPGARGVMMLVACILLAFLFYALVFAALGVFTSSL